MTSLEDGSYPRPNTTRRWTRGQALVLWSSLVWGASFPIWCRPLILFVNAAIETWPAEITSLIGLTLLGMGAMLARAVYTRLNDARVSLIRIAFLTILAFVLIPPGTILLVEGVGYLFGTPQAR